MIKLNRTKKYIFFSLLFFLIGIFLQLSVNFALGQDSRILILWPNFEKAKPNLQLQTFPFIILPLPSSDSSSQSVMQGNSSNPQGLPSNPPNFLGGNYCPVDAVKPPGSSCQCLDDTEVVCPLASINDKCPTGYFPGAVLPDGIRYCYASSPVGSNPTPPPSDCKVSCVYKPVVYLYPEKPTLISVEVEAPGEVIVSDPLYPKSGWKNVFAKPDGSLMYQGKQYNELFYETSVNRKIEMPEEGIIIPSDELKEKLSLITQKLGLINKEQEEFLEYWVPVLTNLKSPYIFFSILPRSVKENIDKLKISPEPKTRIEFIAYFKPLKEQIKIKALKLPENPPERIGFTEVEWGGTIGY